MLTKSHPSSSLVSIRSIRLNRNRPTSTQITVRQSEDTVGAEEHGQLEANPTNAGVPFQGSEGCCQVDVDVRGKISVLFRTSSMSEITTEPIFTPV